MTRVNRNLRSWKSVAATKNVAVDVLSLLRDTDDKNDVGHVAAFAAQVGLPQSPLVDANPEMPWVRRNGNLEVRVVPLTGQGIPWGVIPRQFLAILSSDVIVRQNEPNYWEIDLGRNLSDLLIRRLGIKPTGGKNGSITRFKQGAEMLMTSAVSVIRYPASPDEKRIIKMSNIADEIELWDNFATPNNGTLWKSYAVLNRKFADGIIKSAVPFSWTVLSGLRDSALGMDLYFCFLRRWWQIERNRGREEFLSYDDLRYWFGSQYEDNKTGRQSFKRAAEKQIENIVKLCGGDARITKAQEIRGTGGKIIRGIWLHNSPKAIIRPEQMKKQ